MVAVTGHVSRLWIDMTLQALSSSGTSFQEVHKCEGAIRLAGLSARLRMCWTECRTTVSI